MTKKRFIEPGWALILILTCIMLIPSFGLMIFITWQSFYLYMILFILLEIFLLKLACPACCAILTIKEGCIVWKCPLHKTLTIAIEDCKYVGVEDSSANMRVSYSQQLVIDAYGRSDFFAYIYLSDKPYPEKYRHKASTAPCKKGFIKFSYSDELCEALCEILPKEKVGPLKAFYVRMQMEDEAKRREKEKKKRKEEAKKLKRRKNKEKS